MESSPGVATVSNVAGLSKWSIINFIVSVKCFRFHSVRGLLWESVMILFHDSTEDKVRIFSIMKSDHMDYDYHYCFLFLSYSKSFSLTTDGLWAAETRDRREKKWDNYSTWMRTVQSLLKYYMLYCIMQVHKTPETSAQRITAELNQHLYLSLNKYQTLSVSLFFILIYCIVAVLDCTTLYWCCCI